MKSEPGFYQNRYDHISNLFERRVTRNGIPNKSKLLKSTRSNLKLVTKNNLCRVDTRKTIANARRQYWYPWAFFLIKLTPE